MYTYKQIAEIAGCSLRTVKEIVKTKFPEIRAGKGNEVNIEPEIAIKIMEIIPKKNMVEKCKTALPKVQNCTTARIDRLESMVEKLCGAVAAMVTARPAQIAIEQDYFSILGYCNKRGLTLKFSDAIRYGKEAARISADTGYEVRRIADERFGTVGSYHVSVLEKVFSL
jgi:hypothetical protein